MHPLIFTKHKIYIQYDILNLTLYNITYYIQNYNIILQQSILVHKLFALPNLNLTWTIIINDRQIVEAFGANFISKAIRVSIVT